MKLILSSKQSPIVLSLALVVILLVVFGVVLWLGTRSWGGEISWRFWSDPPTTEQQGGLASPAPEGPVGDVSEPVAEPGAVVAQAGVDVRAACSAKVDSFRPGAVLEIGVEVTSSSARAVGIGATLYHIEGVDEWYDAANDKPRVDIPAGRSVHTRSFNLPSELPNGSFELYVGIWTAGAVGVGDPLAGADCSSASDFRFPS